MNTTSEKSEICYKNNNIALFPLNQLLPLLSFASHIALAVAIVAIVSPNWTNIVAKKVVSSILSLLESALANAVIDAVNWHEFMIFPPADYLLHSMKKAKHQLQKYNLINNSFSNCLNYNEFYSII